ncbi:hypothetical protein [Pedococcus sp. P5_B7]
MTQPARRRGRSNVAKFWIGVALCIPALFLVGGLESLPTVVGNAVNLPNELSTIATLGLNVGLLAAFIVGLVRESTRFIMVGMLAGLAIVFVLAAGACVVLLVGLSNPN